VILRASLGRLVEILTPSASAKRAAMRGLDDKRRDQILAAAMLVNDLMTRLGIEQIQVCRSALREGIVVDYVARHRPELELRGEVPQPRRRAIVNLGRRSHWNRAHAEQVARMCMQLFDGLRAVHGLGPAERELIEYGALLHDIGAMIGRPKHHKHSAYLILHGALAPFARREVWTIACVARYHRKSYPGTARDEVYARLPKRLRRAVKVGAALLRIADGLDRTNCSVIADVKSRVRPDEVQILVTGRGDAELEIYSAQARATMFESYFDRRVVVSRAE